MQTSTGAAGEGENATALCKFWANAKCKGGGCRFRHAFLDEAERQHSAELRRHKEELKQRQHDPLDPFEDKLPRSTRALVFGEWLVKTFGAERLRQGSGVVDVAGGKGYLSFQLQCAGHDVPTTLIEPRPAKLHRKQVKLLKKQKKPAFRQVCAWFEPKLWSETDSEEASPRHAEADGTARATRRDEEEEEGDDHQTAPSEASSSTTTSQLNLRVERLEAETARTILRDCSAVVGLHSDQATEPIVDFALAHNKCFAVVPCCVFPSQFPDRRLKDGQRVVVPEEFIRYLMEKDARIKVDYLEMAGRNKVVYMLP